LAFANAATVHETSTAELAVTLALASQRGIPEFVRAGDEGRWDLREFPSLADRRVLLVGYGGVAKAVEARLAGFEVQLTRLARSAREEQNLAGDTVEVRGFEDLHECLADAEVVILAVPLTDGTRGLVDAAALAAMPDDALLVNVARGPVVDTDALVAELQAGRLRAALDVTDPEPLPEDHPLWKCPNTLITPHVGGDSSAMAHGGPDRAPDRASARGGVAREPHRSLLRRGGIAADPPREPARFAGRSRPAACDPARPGSAADPPRELLPASQSNHKVRITPFAGMDAVGIPSRSPTPFDDRSSACPPPA
jgi:hypothetical protein